MGSSVDRPQAWPALLLYGGIVFCLFVAVPAAVLLPPRSRTPRPRRRGAPIGAGTVRAAWPMATRTTKSAGRPTAGRRARGRRHRAVLHLGSRPSGALGAGFRVLRYDYYGRGYSDRPGHPVHAGSVRPAAPRTARVPAHHAADRPRRALIRRLGHHHASPIAYPARVRSLIYMDPAFRTPQTLSPLECDAAAVEFHHRHPRRARVGGRPARRLPVSGTISRTGRIAIACSCRIAASAARVCRTCAATLNYDQRDELQRVGRARRPVLVCGASRIQTCRSSSARR